MLVAANLSTWRGLETDSKDVSFHDSHLIREGNRLEPHLLVGIVRLVLLKDLRIQRSQVLLVHMTRHEEHGVSCGVCREWLVQWVISHNIWILREAA